jgi:hypothetical protein
MNCTLFKEISISLLIIKQLKFISMKKLLLLSMIFVSLSVYCQSVSDSLFVFDSNGFNSFVITKVPNKTQSELFKKTIDWVAVGYKNPKEVIKAQIDNDYIRIEGSSETLVCLNILLKEYCPAKYMIEISLKDGKYKFEVISLEYYISPSQYSRGGWMSLRIYDNKTVLKSSGEIKAIYKYMPENFTAFFNNLNRELFNFLSSSNIPSKKSDW